MVQKFVCVPVVVIVLSGKNSPQDHLKPLANGTVNEEVNWGIDGEKKMVGTGKAEVPGGTDQYVVASAKIKYILEYEFKNFVYPYKWRPYPMTSSVNEL